MADLLPDDARGVQCFYYGDGYPLGFCAQNPENGMMIDALVVPLSLPQEPEKPGEENGQAGQPEREQPEAEQPEAEQSEAEPAEQATASERKRKRRGRKLAIAQPEEANGADAPADANGQDTDGQDAPPAEQPAESNGKAKRRRTKKVAV